MALKIPPIIRVQEASDTPFDNSTNGFVSTDVQAAIEEISSSNAITYSLTAVFDRSGSVSSNTWLMNQTVPSQISGVENPLLVASIVKIGVSNQDATSGIILDIYSHDGDSNNLTLLGSVTTVATRSNTFTVSYSLATGKQIAIKTSASSVAAKNLTVYCVVKGKTS